MPASVDGGHDGGHEAGGSDAPADQATGWRARLKRHRLLASGVAVVVLAAAVLVPLTVAGDDTPCWQVPDSVRALADDPAAATKALDPGPDLERMSDVKRLLVHEEVCGDGATVLGRVVTAATDASSPTATHTEAQARSVYAVADAYEYTDPPAGLAPTLARMLAEYVVDVVRDYQFADDDVPRPAVGAEEEVPAEDGWVWVGSFLAPGEAHVAFGYRGEGGDVSLQPMIRYLLTDPAAFAVLYGADRAYLAYYLERLTDDGRDPAAHRGKDGNWTDRATRDLGNIAECIGELMGSRTHFAQEGDIPDLDSFDRVVRGLTPGVYHPASRQLDTRPASGTIAARPVNGPLRGDLTDGRHQMFTVFDTWSEQRHLAAPRRKELRQLLDTWYVRGVWYAASARS